MHHAVPELSLFIALRITVMIFHIYITIRITASCFLQVEIKKTLKQSLKFE